MAEQVEVEGAYKYGEYDDKFHARVGFNCPLCGRRHIQKVAGTGKAPDGVLVETKCGRGRCFVKPYR